MKYFLSFTLLCTSFFLFGQAFYDFESDAQGWTTHDNPYTHLQVPSRSTTWRLTSQTGGTAPLILGSTWFGTPNAGQMGAERSWIISPTLYVNQTTVSVNFDSYTSNEGGFLYDRERIQVSINGSSYQQLHEYDLQLHTHADRTFRNITYSFNANVGDKIIFRFLYDTGDGITGGLTRNILGWYVDNIAIDGADEAKLETSISMPESMIYYGYAPMSCTTLEASSTGSIGEVTYTWSINDVEIDSGEFTTVCADGPQCMIVTVVAEDELGNISEAKMIVEVMDVRCLTIGNTSKISVCHNPGTPNQETLCVNVEEVADYLANGDLLGGCNASSSCSQALVQEFNNAQQSVAHASEREVSTNANISAVPLFDLSTMTIEDKRVHIYPNPAATIANVRFHQAIEGPVNIEVYNQLGQLILMAAVNANGGETTDLNVSALPPGIYKLKIRLENNTFHTQQLVVMR